MLTELEKMMLNSVGLSEDDLKAEVKPTIEDVVEALDLLASIVLNEVSEDD